MDDLDKTNASTETTTQTAAAETSATSTAAAPAAEPTQTTTTQTAAPAGRTVETLEVELAGNLVAMENLRNQLGALQGTTKEVQAKRDGLMNQLTAEVNKRAGLETELAGLNAKLEEASQATQTALSEKSAAEETAKNAAAKAATAEARAVKLETIAKDYPELLRYAEFIPASESADEVKASCEKLKAARTQDLDGYRKALGGVNPLAASPINPGRPLEPSTPADLEGYLKGAFNNPAEFEARVSAAIEKFGNRS